MLDLRRRRADVPHRARLNEDRALFARYVDSRDALDRAALVERFLPLARQLARRYGRPDEPFDDLFQVACLGLLNAIDRFDLERDVAFSSYAVPTIVGEIKRYYRDKTWAIRVPRDLQDRALKVERMATRLEARLRRAPTVPELARACGCSEEAALEALQALEAHGSVSLDAPRGFDDAQGSVADGVGCDDPAFEFIEERATLTVMLGTLTVREREVLRLRFEHDLTQSEIGRIIGISQMQVSRIIRQAIARLREAQQAGA